MTNEMWERVARNVDPVGKIVENGMSLLNLREDDQYAIRFTPIEKELIKWIAHLRFSEYLLVESKLVVNIHGEALNVELKDLTGNINEYRRHYFQEALETELENIRYPNMNVKSDDILEEIQPHQFLLDESDTEE